MSAIVHIAGQQLHVRTADVVHVPTLNYEVGEVVTFDQVLLTQIDEKTLVGKPTVTGAKVVAKVLDHIKGPKITVFKKKRRKGYKVKQGHRQPYTKICIEKIMVK